jgi:hypothetical protein
MLNSLIGIIASSGGGVPNSYESIATVTLTSNQNTISFTSIPSTYQHLQIRGIFNTTAGDLLLMRWNNISTTNYSYHALTGNGSAASASGGGSASGMYVGDPSVATSIFTGVVIDILDYADGNKNKTSRTLAGYDANGSGNIRLWSGMYYGATTAISRIDLITTSSNMLTNSSFALYGIKG